MADRTTSESRLAALGAHLGARGLTVNLTAHGLYVQNPDEPGCCDEAKHPADTITCRTRPDDGGRLWFFTSWGAPIARAERIDYAALTVRAALSGRSTARVVQ